MVFFLSLISKEENKKKSKISIRYKNIIYRKYIMFNFIIQFFSTSKTSETNNQKFCNIYNKQYRSAYNKLWIEKLRNNTP